ncbi:MAG: CHAT domain-containing protein [Thermoanaerobaculia bacterium]
MRAAFGSLAWWPAGALLALGLALGTGCRPAPSRGAAPSPTPPAASLGRSAGEAVGDLAPPARARYQIDLVAGEYLELVVEQQGVDLTLHWLDPGGDGLSVDNWSGADGRFGPERLCWVTARTGPHHLELVPRPGTSGRYRLAVTRLGPAGPQDLLRARSERQMARGDELLAERGGSSRRLGIEEYLAALAGFTALGERHREADAWFRLAEAQAAAGEAAALGSYGAALGLYRQQGDPRQEALCLHHRGYLLADQHRAGAALADFEAALPLWRRAADLQGEALSDNELGLLYRQLGELGAALAAYDRALELWRQLGDNGQEARTLHNRGRLYALLGYERQSLADLGDALSIRRQRGQPAEIASTLSSLGLVLARQGSFEQARARFAEALTVDSGGGRSPGLSSAIARLGRARVELARAAEPAALPPELVAEIDRELGAAEEVFGQRREAAWQATVLGERARLAERQGRLGPAGERFEQALRLFRVARDRRGEADTLGSLARLEHRRGASAAAARHLDQALELVEDLRSRVATSAELRVSFFATQQSLYDFAIELAEEAHRPQEALGLAERAKARALLELLASRRGSSGTAPAADTSAAESLGRRVTALELELVQLAGDEASRSRVATLERQQAELLRQLGRLGPAVASPARTLSAREIQRRLLDADTLLLEYRLGERESHLWALSRSGLASYTLPPRSRLEAAALEAHQAAVANRRQARERTRDQLAALGSALLGPAARAIGAHSRLVIVPDGALYRLPFTALPDPLAPDQPLAFHHELVTLPSASILGQLRREAELRPAAPGLLAVVADPVFEAGDPRLASLRGKGAPATAGPYRRLPWAGEEAAAILELVPGARRFAALGFDAHRQQLESPRLAGYSILHIATHGELDEEHPELSRLAFSLFDPEGRPRSDGLLHAFEIYELRLPVQLLVLSACNTALGKSVRGEGLLGLAHSFFYAGALRILVSLWDVDDRSTAELMRRFYRGLLVEGRSPPSALREAQLALARDPRWSQPHYWAGFELLGEWRDFERGLPALAAKPSRAEQLYLGQKP